MALHYLFERDGALFPVADAFEDAFGEIHVLEILKMFEDGLPGVVGLRASRAPGEFFQALFNGQRKPNGEHKQNTPLYKFIIQRSTFGADGRHIGKREEKAAAHESGVPGKGKMPG